MYSNHLKTNLLLSVLVTILLISCSNKSDKKDQISVTVRAIDKYTKQPRLKTYDTIIVRMGKPSLPMRRYIKVGEYITDSLAEVKIPLHRAERYSFDLYGTHVFGWVEYAEKELKDGQQVIIEVGPPEKKKNKITMVGINPW